MPSVHYSKVKFWTSCKFLLKKKKAISTRISRNAVEVCSEAKVTRARICAVRSVNVHKINGKFLRDETDKRATRFCKGIGKWNY